MMRFITFISRITDVRCLMKPPYYPENAPVDFKDLSNSNNPPAQLTTEFLKQLVLRGLRYAGIENHEDYIDPHNDHAHTERRATY